MTDTDHPHPDVPPIPSRAGRWPFYLLALVAGILLVFVIPPAYAILLLVGLIVAAVTVSARDAEVSPRDVVGALRHLVNISRAVRQGSPVFVERHRAVVITGNVLAAAALMSFSALEFRPANPESALITGVFWMVLGVIALGVALAASRQNESLLVLAQTPLAPARSHPIVSLAGIALLLVFAEINGQRLNLPFLRPVSLHVQFLLMCVGMFLLIWGFSGAPRLRPVQWFLTHWRVILPLLSIFILALVVRVWHLDTTVYGLVDETLAINNLWGVTGTRDTGLAVPLGRFATTPLYSYLQSGLVTLVGNNLAGLRAASALVGSFTVVALYLLAQTLFDRKTALIAAFLLATFPPHIHFSRIALTNIADPLFGTFALAFLARGLKDNRRFDWAAAGVSLGLTQYFFEAGRLFFVPLIIIWILALAVMMSLERLTMLWRGLVVMSLAVVFVGMPVYYTIFAQNAPRTSRLDASGMDSAYWQQFAQDGLTADQINELVRRVTFPFRVYVHQPEIGVFYGGHQPMVLEYLVPIFLLGVACTFWRGRSPALLVLLWLIAAALGNSLLRDSAVYARYNVVFPAVALTMAVALRYLPPLLWHTAPKSWLMILTLLITGLIGAVQVNYYFGSHVETLENQLRNAKPYRDGFDAVMRAADLPGDTSIYLISEPVNDVNAVRALIGFLHPTPDNRVVVTLPTHQLTADFLSQLPSGKPYAFFVEPSDESTVRLLGQYFELGEPQASLKAIPLEKQYLLYFVPAAE